MVIIIFTAKLRVKCWKEKYLRIKIEYLIIIHTYNRINYSIIIFYSTKNYRSLQFIMEITLFTNYINFLKIISNDNLLRNTTVHTILEIRFKIYPIYLKIT